jgi:hypothetical protein
METKKTNKKDIRNFVYVRVTYCGYIPELNINGPFISFIKKDDVITLIKHGYHVEVMNKKYYKEFCEQLDRFYKAQKDQKDEEMMKIRSEIAKDEREISESMKKLEERKLMQSIRESVQASVESVLPVGTTNPISQMPLAPVTNKAALDGLTELPDKPSPLNNSDDELEQDIIAQRV